MFKEIAGIAHQVLASGSAMMFVDVGAERSHTATSGIAASASGEMPESEIKMKLANGWRPAKMAEIEAIFIKAECQQDGVTPEQAKAKFAAKIVKG